MSPAAIVFVLCLLTSGACALLLFRAFRRTRTRLLLWASLGFGFLALNNCVLVLEAVVFPTIDLRWPRLGAALAAVAVFLYGFIWETDR